MANETQAPQFCSSCYGGMIVNGRCDNPGCIASGNVPPEIIARREREDAEIAERVRFSHLRSGSWNA